MERGFSVSVVPWDYDISNESYEGIFISNGPGDPQKCQKTIENIRIALQNNIPIFGICLGHQILALAAGAKTIKMAFGNRGHNIPCKNVTSNRCYITSQVI